MSFQNTDVRRDDTVIGVEAAAMRGPRHDRNTFMASLTEAVRDNPVPAALIGMGAFWLFAGGGNMTLLGGRGRKSILGAAANGAGSVAHGVSDMAQGAAQSVGRMGSAIASGASSTAGGIAETVSDTVSRVGEYVSHGIHGVDAQSEYRNPNFSDARSQSSVTGMAGDITSGLKDMFDRHPVALGVAGVALGAAVAASLPLTDAEREALGKANETVRGKLGEVAGQARDMASAAIDEVSRGTAHGPG